MQLSNITHTGLHQPAHFFVG